MTVGELVDLLDEYDARAPVRVYAGDLRQMFEILDVRPDVEHDNAFARIDVITKELGE